MGTKSAKANTSKQIEADLSLNILGESTQFKIRVPEQKTTPETVLPFAQALTNKVVGKAIEMVEEQGKSISCAKGCGACCSQLVPITETEAKHLTQVIKDLPKARKKEILERFEQAKQQLETADLWPALTTPEAWQADAKAFGLDYFKLNIPCPFLQDGACSIHPDRPLACREYLVTSDPKHCASPDQGEVEGVPIPWKLSKVLGKLWQHDTQHVTEWLPLIVVPYWRSMHPNQPSKRTGPEWVETFLQQLKENT